MALTKVTGHVVKPDTNIQFHNTKSTGIVTFAHTDNATSSTTGALQVTGGVGIVKDLFVGGQLSVGGTITYEDVDNINSVGIITANAGIVLQDYIFHKGDTNTSIGFPAADTIDLGTAGTPRIRIASDGDIGIGTISPSGLTHWVAPSDMNLYLKSKNASGTIRWNYEDEGGTARANHAFVNYGNGKSDFFTWATHDGSTLAERVRISKEGNVGIGSADPGGVLDLYHATSNTILNVKSGDSGSVINLIDNATRSSIEQNGVSLKIISDTVGTYANSDIRLQVDGGTKMMIDHDGYVGINTSNPQDFLHIQGSSGQSTRFTGNQIKFNRASNFSYIDQYGAGDLAIRTTPSGSQENRLVILSGGNIGIGEDAPSEKLQVKGDVLLGSTGGDVALKFEYNNHQFAKIVGNGRDSSGYGDIDFYTSTGSGVTNLVERMTIRADGKVGIATDSPYSNLTVFGENRSDGGTATGQITAKDNAAYNATPTSGLVFQGYFASNNAQAVFGGITGFKENTTNGDYAGALGLHVRANGAVAYEAVRIASNGRVGISSAIPTQTLDVNGNIRSSVLYLDRHGSPTINMTSTSDTGGGSIYFGSPASGVRGGILYDHDGDKLKLRNIYGTSLEINNARKSSFYGDIHMYKGSGEPNATLSLQSHDTVNSTAKINLMARDNSNNNETCSIEANSGSTASVDLRLSTGAGEIMRLKRSGEVHIADRNSSNTGDHFFQAGAFGIRMEDTGGYNRWNIERNYGGYQSVPLIHLSAQGRVGINKALPDSDLHIYNSGGAKLTLETADNADAWINFSGNSNEMSFGFDKSDGAMILANNDGIQNDRRISISTLGHVNIGQGIASANETVYFRYDLDTANRSYSNGGQEGFVINTNRKPSGSGNNYEGVVDLVAGRGSDNSNGGTRFRIFAQPRNTSINRMIMDLNGTRNHVRMGNTCIYSYGDQTGGEFGSGDYTYYDHKVGSQITQNDFSATRARDANGGYGYNGGIEAKQTTNVQSFATPYRYTLSTPNHESDSANRYYPVSINTSGRAGGGMVHNLQVARRYYDSGPAHQGGSTIGWTGSSTHQGGLDLFLQVRDSAWSDMYDMRILHYRYTYHQTVGGWGMFASSSSSYGAGPFYLMLRGGFQYKFYASYPLAVANVEPGGRVYSTSYAWFWPSSTTSTSGPLSNFGSAYYAGTA